MRLIDVDALKRAFEIEQYNDYDDLLRTERIIDNAPIVERPHGEWIPCSDRLAEECKNVLAWIERDAWIDGRDEPIRVQECAIGWHIEGRWHFYGYAGSTTECIAWMPLPEPYQKEGEAE